MVFSPRELDDAIVGLLRESPQSSPVVRASPRTLIERAERHGVAAAIHQSLLELGIGLDDETTREIGLRAVARDLDHAAHLNALRCIDASFSDAGLRGVVLKGAVLALRYHPLPSGRATSDLDVMVAERDLGRATEVLASLGYREEEGPKEERFRREHHHLNFQTDSGPLLELHFHAYRGFGSHLRSEQLIARRQVVDALPRGALGVLAVDDELVFLSVHAAAHRYVRLGWLYDLRLLINRMAAAEIESAGEIARATGYRNVLAFTAHLLASWIDDPTRLKSLSDLGTQRRAALMYMFPEPPTRIRRATTRFAYALLLCDSLTQASRFAVRSVESRARLLFSDE